MEYLPEKKRTQKAQVLKKEEKTKQFREYLANNDVVLSMVKCKWDGSSRIKNLSLDDAILNDGLFLYIDLLTVRSKEPLP